MKIDPKIPLTGELQNNQVQNNKASATRLQSAGNAGGGAHVPTDDTFQLSTKHGEVHQLSAQSAQLPDVRAGLVQPLQSQVRNGSYHPDSGKVADAILAEHVGHPAKA